MNGNQFKKKWANYMPYDEALLEFERDVDDMILTYAGEEKQEPDKCEFILCTGLIGLISGGIIGFFIGLLFLMLKQPTL